MPKYKVVLTANVFLPEQEMEIEADSQEAAEEKIDEMWDKGELEWLLNKAELDDLSEARITEIVDMGEPDWSKECSNCGGTPVVPETGMCGPCTFGEGNTAAGNW